MGSDCGGGICPGRSKVQVADFRRDAERVNGLWGVRGDGGEFGGGCGRV